MVSVTHTQEQAHATLSRTKTALLRYTLPGWGFVLPKGGKLTNWETEMALNYMKDISLEQFGQAARIQQQVFDLQQVPSNSQRTYRAALKKLLAWCEQQQWWLKSQHNIATIFSPPRKQKRSAVDFRVTDRKYIDRNGQQIQSFHYGLGFVEGDVIPKKLQHELDDFKRFRTDRNNSSSKNIVRDSTCQKELKNIRMVLGWLYRFKDVPLAKISLLEMIRFPSVWHSNHIVVLEQSKIVAKQTVALFKEYIQWLESDIDNNTSEERGRGIKSKHTKISVARTFIVVARYLHCKGHFHDDIDNGIVLLTQSLNCEIATIKDRNSDSISSADISKKWLDWPDFLALVEQLRKECNSRVLQDIPPNKAKSNLGNLRSLPAIANSYQRFIFAALLAYLPPQNQQIYRQLENSHCRKYEHIKDNNELLGISGCLYQKDDVWYIYLLPDEYKMGARQIQLSFEIPNIDYSDGRNFYQYLNEWVYEYIYLKYYDRTMIDGLRNILNPQHDFLFTKKNGKEYLHQTEFSNLLRIPAYRISGKALTPGLLKHVFLKYMREEQRHLLIDNKFDFWMSDPAEISHDYDIWRRSSKEIEAWIGITKRIAQEFVHPQNLEQVSFHKD
jgi:hypothetical protein